MPLAKSWLNPPELQLDEGDVKYEPAERAYLVDKLDNNTLRGKLLANPDQPASGPAIVFNQTQLENPEVKINQRTLVPGKDFQHGIVKDLDNWKTIIWINDFFDKTIDLVIRENR